MLMKTLIQTLSILFWWATQAHQQIKLVAGSSEPHVQLSLLEDVGISTNSYDSVNTLLQTVPISAMTLNSKKQETFSENRVQYIGGMRNNNKVSYFLVRDGVLKAFEVVSDSNGFVKMPESTIADLTNSTSSPKNYPICSNLVITSDRVLVLCKEMLSNSNSSAILKVFSFLKLDFAQSSQHKYETSTFTYQTSPDRSLEGVACSFKSGSEIIDYVAVFESPASGDPPAASSLFFYTLKDHKLKPLPVNINSQIASFNRLLSFGCNSHPTENTRYLFLTSTDSTQTYIVPITDNLLTQLFNDQKFVPITKPTQYTLGSGLILQSAQSMGTSNQVLAFYLNQQTQTYRIARTQLLYVSLDVATANSKFLADVDGTTNMNIVSTTKCPFLPSNTTFKFRQVVNSLIFTLEFLTGSQPTDPVIIDVIINQNNLGGYFASRRLVTRLQSYIVTVRSATNPAGNEPEYLVSSRQANTSLLPSSSKHVDILSTYSLMTTNFGISAALLTNGSTYLSRIADN